MKIKVKHSHRDDTIHDRDPLYTKLFDSIMKDSGTKIIKIPPLRPMMNAFAESFVKTIKSECFDKMIIVSEDHLRYVLKEYIQYYNHERPHRGLNGRMIEPYDQDQDGDIVEFTRLGGLLRYYRRIKKKLPEAA